MEESIVFLIAGIFLILVVLGAYIIKNVFVPKKIEEIDELVRSGNTALAIKQLKSLIEKDERNPYVHFLLGEAYYIEKNYPYAVVEFKQVVKLGKYDHKVREAVVRGRLAKLYKEMKNLEDAKKEYIILTKIDPYNFDHFYQTGVIFFNAGLHDKAMPYFNQAINLNPKHGEAYYFSGQISYLKGSMPEAKKRLVEAVKLKPNNYKAHYFLGLTLRNLKDLDWALQEFEQAQKDPDIQQKAFLASGTCYIEKEQLGKAIVELERGLKASKKDFDTELNLRYYLAACAEQSRDLHTAIEQWEIIDSKKSNFRDVPSKLKNYEEFRTDDSIKDFMIASPAKFEQISIQMIQQMELDVSDLKVESDSLIEALATETQGKWRNTKRSNQLIRILRTTDSVPEQMLRNMQEVMRQKNASRGIVISTGEFTPAAIEFASSRPIELYDKSKVIQLLRGVDL